MALRVGGADALDDDGGGVVARCDALGLARTAHQLRQVAADKGVTGASGVDDLGDLGYAVLGDLATATHNSALSALKHNLVIAPKSVVSPKNVFTPNLPA